MSRVTYQPSGKLHWGWLALWSALPFAVAIFLGALTYGALRLGILFLLVAGLLAGSLIGGANWMAVRGAHCRGRVPAAFVGVIAALLYFVAYFQAGIVRDLGWAGIARFDLLPAYVQMRMESDLVISNNLPTPKKDRRPNPRTNWGLMAFDALIVTGLAMLYSGAAAMRPYCESQQSWLKSKMIYCRGDYYGDLRRRINAGPVVSSLGDLERVTAREPGDLILMLYYCPHVRYPERPVEMYMALGEYQGERDQVMLRGKIWNLPQMELYPREFDVACRLFDVPAPPAPEVG